MCETRRTYNRSGRGCDLAARRIVGTVLIALLAGYVGSGAAVYAIDLQRGWCDVSVSVLNALLYVMLWPRRLVWRDEICS